MSLASILVNYIQANWGGAIIPPVNMIHFDEGWFDAKEGQIKDAQITVTDAWRPVGQMFAGKGVLHSRIYPRLVVNCWYRIPRGDLGTLQIGSIDVMRRETVRVIQAGWLNIFSAAGRICIPLDEGRALHELEVTPRILRYEITVMGTRDL